MLADLPDAALSAIVAAAWGRGARRALRACCRRLRAATDLQLSTLHLAAGAEGLGLPPRALRDVAARFANVFVLRICTPPGADLGPLARALAALPPGGWPSVRILIRAGGAGVEARLVAPIARLCPGLAVVNMRCGGGSGGFGGGGGCVGGAYAAEALADGWGNLKRLALNLGPEERSGGLAARTGRGNSARSQAGDAQQGVFALAAALRRLRGLQHLVLACEGGDAGCAAARSALLPAVLPALPGVTSVRVRSQGGSGQTMVVGGGSPGLRELALHARDAPVARMAATLQGGMPGVTSLELSHENR
jgi:hypothetical protein